MTKLCLWNIKIKVKQAHGVECKVTLWLCFLSLVHFRYFSILKKCNMKRAQHEKSATWKKCNIEIVDA